MMAKSPPGTTMQTEGSMLSAQSPKKHEFETEEEWYTTIRRRSEEYRQYCRSDGVVNHNGHSYNVDHFFKYLLGQLQTKRRPIALYDLREFCARVETCVSIAMQQAGTKEEEGKEDESQKNSGSDDVVMGPEADVKSSSSGKHSTQSSPANENTQPTHNPDSFQIEHTASARKAENNPMRANTRLDYSARAWTMPPSPHKENLMLDMADTSLNPMEETTQPSWKRSKSGKVLAPPIICDPATFHALDKLENKIWPNKLIKFNAEASCAVCHGKPRKATGMRHCRALRVDCVSACTYLLCEPCFCASFSTVRRSAPTTTTQRGSRKRSQGY